MHLLLRLPHLLLLLLGRHLLHTAGDHNLLHLRHRHTWLHHHTLHLHTSRALCHVGLHACNSASTVHLLSHLTVWRLRRLRCRSR